MERGDMGPVSDSYTSTCETPLVKRVSSVALCMAMVLLVAVGCSAGTTVQRADGIRAMVAGSQPSAVMEALISGTLTITDSGCFAVTSGGVTYPVLFPFGTRLSEDGAEVAVPGVPPLSVGDEISGGGGYVHLTDVDPACRADNEYDEYAVWQTVAG
jgi:hypothetical protein